MEFLAAEANGGVSIRLHIQPRASVTGISGTHGNALKLRITAPPVDGKANGMIIVFFSKLFKVPKAAVRIASGSQSRGKRVVLDGVDLERAKGILKPFVT